MSQHLDDLCELPPIQTRATKAKRKSTAKRASVGPEMLQQQAVVSWINRVLPGAIVQHVKNEAAPKTTGFSAARFHMKRKKAGMTWGFPICWCSCPMARRC